MDECPLKRMKATGKKENEKRNENKKMIKKIQRKKNHYQDELIQIQDMK